MSIEKEHAERRQMAHKQAVEKVSFRCKNMNMLMLIICDCSLREFVDHMICVDDLLCEFVLLGMVHKQAVENVRAICKKPEC